MVSCSVNDITITSVINYISLVMSPYVTNYTSLVMMMSLHVTNPRSAHPQLRLAHWPPAGPRHWPGHRHWGTAGQAGPCGWVQAVMADSIFEENLVMTLGKSDFIKPYRVYTPLLNAKRQKSWPEKCYTTYCHRPLGLPKNAFGLIRELNFQENITSFWFMEKCQTNPCWSLNIWILG